ncbi:hypothetical protein LSAT2_019655 [Lamellibrachia satsuma]|nr:hypothetical protein LSAT2_019655 [Lamellibrachia satsuma]
MASSQKEMPRVDMQKEFAKMSTSDQHFIKKLEKLNTDRAKTVKMMRGRNLLVGALLGTGAIAIYVYAMAAVKQETFLDFEEMPPEKK